MCPGSNVSWLRRRWPDLVFLVANKAFSGQGGWTLSVAPVVVGAGVAWRLGVLCALSRLRWGEQGIAGVPLVQRLTGGGVRGCRGGVCVGADQTSTWGETCVALGVRWGRRVSPRLAPIGDSGGHALVGSGEGGWGGLSVLQNGGQEGWDEK